MKAILALFALALSGCAGVGEMRDTGPYATFTSAKSPDSLAACMSEAWTNQERWPQTPDVRINPITNGTQVMIYNSHGMSPDVFADIIRDGESSRIMYYAKHREAFKKTFADLTRDCL